MASLFFIFVLHRSPFWEDEETVPTAARNRRFLVDVQGCGDPTVPPEAASASAKLVHFVNMHKICGLAVLVAVLMRAADDGSLVVRIEWWDIVQICGLLTTLSLCRASGR